MKPALQKLSLNPPQVVLRIHKGVLHVSEQHLHQLGARLNVLVGEPHATDLLHYKFSYSHYFVLLRFHEPSFSILAQIRAQRQKGLLKSPEHTVDFYVMEGSGWIEDMILPCGKNFVNVTMIPFDGDDANHNKQERKVLTFATHSPGRLGFNDDFRRTHTIPRHDWVACPRLYTNASKDPMWLVSSLDFHLTLKHGSSDRHRIERGLGLPEKQSSDLKKQEELRLRTQAAEHDAQYLPTANLDLQSGRFSPATLLKSQGTTIHLYDGHVGQSLALKLHGHSYYHYILVEPSRLDQTPHFRLFATQYYGFPEMDFYADPSNAYAYAHRPRAGVFVQPHYTNDKDKVSEHKTVEYYSMTHEWSDMLQEEAEHFQRDLGRRSVYYELMPLQHDSAVLQWRWPTPNERTLRRVNRQERFNVLPSEHKKRADQRVTGMLQRNNTSIYERRAPRPIVRQRISAPAAVHLSETRQPVAGPSRPAFYARQSTQLRHVPEDEGIALADISGLPHTYHPSNANNV